jgi:hypothetical protein
MCNEWMRGRVRIRENNAVISLFSKLNKIHV